MLISIRTFSMRSVISSSSDSLFLIVGISYPWWSEFPIPDGRNSLSLVVGIPYPWWLEFLIPGGRNSLSLVVGFPYP
jgi:hypothetical protein